MKEIKKYISEDGREFDEKWKCKEYEINNLFNQTKIVALDCDLKILSNDNIDDVLYKCEYIYIKDEIDYNVIKTVYNYYDYNYSDICIPDGIGMWKYDGHGLYVQIDEKIEELQKEIDKLNKVKEMLNK